MKQQTPKEHVELINDNIEEFDKVIELFKQETLEEVAKEFGNNSAVTNYQEGINVGKYQGFIEGAKWQKEQIGKSEFLQKLRETLSDAEARRLINETFKNK
jgi:hypothetical protein